VYVNGTSPSSQHPQVKLGSVGLYTVTLTATNPQGSGVLTKTDYIRVLSYNAPASEFPIASSDDIGISRVRISFQKPLSDGSFTTQTVSDVFSALKSPVYDKVFETQTAVLYRGVNYKIEVERTTTVSGMTRTVWFDRTLDADFIDSLEQIYSEQNTYNRTATAWLMIPSGVETGRMMRLRAGVTMGGTALTADKATAGCFEDYGILVGTNDIAPQVTLKGQAVYRVEVNKTFTDPGVMAWDDLEGDISPRIQTVSNLDITRAGIYTIQYSVKDLYGNLSNTVTRTIQVEINRTGPTITLNGSDTIYVEVFSPYTDPGATATDNLGGSLDGRLLVSGTVDNRRLDTYYITYTVTDQFDYTTTKTRVVIVRDTQAPVIGNTYGGGFIRHQINTPYLDQSIMLVDNYYGRSELSLVRTGPINTNIAKSYYLKYQACDPSGNCAGDYYVEVRVGDTIGPAVVVLGANPLYTEVFEPFTDPQVAATDNYYADNSLIIIRTGTVNTSQLGSFTLSYSVRDGAGNTTTAERTVIVRDTKAPVIRLLGSNPMDMRRFADYSEPGFKIEDNYNSDPELRSRVTITTTLGTRSGDTLWADLWGWKYIRYQVSDLSGNVSQIEERQIRVSKESTGLADAGRQQAISVYPNPNKGLFSISLPATAGSGTATLYNALGAAVHSQPVSAAQTSVHATGLAAGVYLLHISIDGNTFRQRVVVE
jgi:PKD repeat protein